MGIEVTSTSDSKEAVAAVNAGSTQEEGKENKSASSTKPDEKTEESDTSENLEESEEQDSEEDQDDSEDEADSQDENEKPKKKSGFKKRIERFQRRLSEKDQEIEYLRKEVMKKSSQQEEKPEATPKTQTDGKPKLEDFEHHEDYIEALTDWKLEQKQKEQEVKSRESHLKNEYQKTIQSFQSKVAEFGKTHSDFQEVIEEVDDIPLSPGFREAVISSDLGPAVMYELAKNREELERINALSPLAAAKEIGKIEARLSKSSEPQKQTKTTKAPPPVKPVGSSSSGSTKKSIYDTSLSQKEYEQLRMEQMRKK